MMSINRLVFCVSVMLWCTNAIAMRCAQNIPGNMLRAGMRVGARHRIPSVRFSSSRYDPAAGTQVATRLKALQEELDAGDGATDFGAQLMMSRFYARERMVEKYNVLKAAVSEADPAVEAKNAAELARCEAWLKQDDVRLFATHEWLKWDAWGSRIETQSGKQSGWDVHGTTKMLTAMGGLSSSGVLLFLFQ